MAGRSRKRIPLVVGGGMNRSGDPKKIAPNETRDCYNMLVRPGPRVEMRHGWLGEAVGDPPHMMFKFVEPLGTYERIGFMSNNLSAGGGQIRVAGTWTNIFTISNFGREGADYANIFGNVYLFYAYPGSQNFGGSAASYRGSVVDQNPFLLASVGSAPKELSGKTAASFLNRLFVGHPTATATSLVFLNPNRGYAFSDPTGWAMSGGMSASLTGTIRTLTISNGTTDAAKVSGGLFTSGTADAWHTVTFDVRGVDSVESLPITLTLEDLSGAVVHKVYEFEVPSRTVNPGWTTFSFETRLPATTTIYAKYKVGNTSRATSPLKSFDVADFQASGPLARGIQVTHGRFVYSHRILDSFYADERPDRIIWCEADNPTAWKAANYIDLKEVPGPVRVLRKGSGRLLAYKDSAIWVFRGVANPNLPLQQERVLFNIGCSNPRAIDIFEDTHFFIDSVRGEVYRWDISGEPVPLCGDRMREYIFAKASLEITPVLEVDAENGEVWVYTQARQIFVYNLSLQAWSRIDIRTAGMGPAYINDLIYMKAEGESRRAMWASIKGTPTQVVKLTGGQTQDVVQGATTSPTASYEFHPMAAQATDDVTVESLAIDHQITASQVGSTTTASVSRDGGATFPNAITVTLAPLATTGVSKRMQVPVWQTSQDVVVKVEHTGLAGPEYFNLTGGDATTNDRGRGTQKTNPTPVSSTL